MTKFNAIKAAAARKPHGTRARYVGARCRCLRCRAANSNYSTERERLRREGDTRELVDATAARVHVLQLSKKGIGYKAVADAAGVSRSVMFKIRSGNHTRIRQSTERAILAVDTCAVADKALVPAGPTWKLLKHLLERGFSKRQLATWLLGHDALSLQLGKEFVTAASAARVRKMCALLEAGRLRRA